MRKLQPCEWRFFAGIDPKARPGVSGSYDIFQDRWWCQVHRCGLEFPRGTAPKSAPTGWPGVMTAGNVADVCRDEVSERERRERTMKWRWRWWYVRTLPRRILDVLRGVDTGGDEY